MPRPADATGTLETALAHARRLLPGRPADAQAQAQEILRLVPGHPQAELVLGAAWRRQGELDAARRVLEPLARTQPNVPAVALEWGLTLGALGERTAALREVGRAVRMEPGLTQGWRQLGDQLMLAGDLDGADEAYALHLKASSKDPRLMEAAAALCDNRLAIAERLLRAHLKAAPTDVAALRMLAETGSRLGRYDDAEKLLARCLALAPGFAAARHNYATVLYRQSKASEALGEVESLLAAEPRNGGYRALQAAILGQLGEYPRAIAAYENLLAAHPQQPKAWMSYGHALKAMGRHDDAVSAYRRSVTLLPSLGEASWSLANLKTFRFTDAEIAGMERQLARTDLAAEDRFHLHFALGKALEDRARFAPSFQHYAAGNALRRGAIAYDPDEISDHVRRSEAFFTPAFFAARQGLGCPAPDPIFVVGLPRSGSTLVEQILSSHSAIEGTMELPNIIGLAKELSGKKTRTDRSAYPDMLAALEPQRLCAFGEDYIARTRVHRRLGRPHFIDKMPNNFAHVGLIHLILPNARIIDARRHPLACCFSGFKQHFARGQNFTYDLTEIGRYYADYVRLMAHYDAVLPGRVHRVIYEEMVADPEREVRRLLEYCGLPFEEGCLRFYENDRAVRTASSEQVRRPIFTEGLEQWKNYEPWLDPLKAALGNVLAEYPDVPKFGLASPAL
ncbi:MAG: sulfotransferase [Alphaproteobacteria bacterium]|nr:sulfotransferase [Alphaproteobacteria bacterium]